MNIFYTILSIIIALNSAYSMQSVRETTERLSRFNLRFVHKFSSQEKIREDISKKMSPIFKGAPPKKQFSAKDLIKDDTINRLTTYAKPINYEGTLLKVKKQESHKEISALKQFSVLRTPGVLGFFEGLQKTSRYLKLPVRFFSTNSVGDKPSTSERKPMQVFSRPTYDRIAKHILARDESVRVDILKAFTGISSISSATPLDQHYNPFDSIHNLRKLVNASASQGLFDSVRKASKVHLTIDGKEDKKEPDILKGIGNFYDDLIHAFPDQRYRSSVDFFCETNFGYVTIEFQVAQEDYWDKRALAYVASIYGNQLKPGKKYSEIQDVVGVNLIGDGDTPYWRDGNFVRDYTLVDERNRTNRIPHLRLIQYSLGDVTLDHR
jgi:hypothetical protein